LLIVLLAVLGHNDTLKAYFLLASAGMGMPCSMAVLIVFHSSADSQIFPCLPENLQFLLLPNDLLLCLYLLG
jgi:hypothetical protein